MSKQHREALRAFRKSYGLERIDDFRETANRRRRLLRMAKERGLTRKKCETFLSEERWLSRTDRWRFSVMSHESFLGSRYWKHFREDLLRIRGVRCWRCRKSRAARHISTTRPTNIAS